MNNNLFQIRVGGVPEHFNEPWIIGLENNYFLNEGIDLKWNSIKEGTGAMINKLKSNEIDLIVALTEGLINEIINGSSIRLIGTYVQSSLTWSISTNICSKYNSIEDLKGEIFGISRYQSGSHLMSCVLASQYGWKQSDIQFSVQNNFDNLRKSLEKDEINAFMWEYFMQKPFYDKGQMKRIGQIITPWPCFLIAAQQDFIANSTKFIDKLFVALQKCCEHFRKNSVESIRRISSKYNLSEEDAKAWFDKVEICPKNEISKSTIETTIDALKTAQIICEDLSRVDPIRFVDTTFAKLVIDIKSMRLYNKPELLISLRNNLRFHQLLKGKITYEDLLPFDQNHYYGTQILDLAVQKLHFNPQDQHWVIQIGSNLAGCARYLAGKYHLKVLAVELQNDLSEAANELTDRCQLSEQVHHISGNFLKVSQHLQENFYSAIVSWITILHFNQQERIKLYSQSYRLLKDKSFFYLEDFIQIGNLTNEESQILEHDVFCQYLPRLDEYKQSLIDAHFHLVEIVDLTDDWKRFTRERLNSFVKDEEKLIDIHGNEIYSRLLYFYRSIVKLFEGNHVGGVRIIAIKQSH